jgi:hypothetical protein
VPCTSSGKFIVVLGSELRVGTKVMTVVVAVAVVVVAELMTEYLVAPWFEAIEGGTSLYLRWQSH